MKGLEAARRLYAEKGAAIIHEHFPEYEGRIAVGLGRLGFACLGFDDEYLAITILSLASACGLQMQTTLASASSFRAKRGACSAAVFRRLPRSALPASALCA